jgi:hypothetical protein
LPIDHHVFADGRRVALCFVVAPCLDSTLCGRNGGVVLSRRLLRRRPSRQPAHATCGGVDRSHNRNPFFVGEPGITAISSFGHLTREVAKRRGRRASLASALFEDRPRHWVSKRDSTYEGGGITNVCRRTVPELRRILYGWN